MSIDIKSLAIVGPKFFTYLPMLSAEFNRRGIRTNFFDEKYSNHNFVKIIFRLRILNNIFPFWKKYLSKLTDIIIYGGYSDVLIVSPEVIDRNFVERLVRNNLRVHLYSWDGSKNKGCYIKFLDLLSSSSSFDPLDAKAYDLKYIPLFASSAFIDQSQPRERREIYDISFCGTVHSIRGKVLSGVIKLARQHGIKVKLLAYYHSRPLFFLRSFFDWSGWALLPLISAKPFGTLEVVDSMRNSRFVLDVAHPKQFGLTARTFEALACGARLITNNRFAVDLLPENLKSRIFLFDRIEEIGSIVFTRIEPLPELNVEERYELSISRFVDQLLATMTPKQTS